MPPSNSDKPSKLFERVAGTPAETLRAGVEQSEGITPEEFEGRKRVASSLRFKHWTYMQIGFYWLLFALFVIFIISLVVVFAMLGTEYLRFVFEDMARIKDLLVTIVGSILLVLATLFIEQNLFDKD